MTTDHPLRNRVAVITGATAGIGEACARALVKAGARVVLNARREQRLRQMVDEFGAEDACFVAGDAGDEGVVQRALDAATSEFGREADLVIVNAGRGLKGSVLDSDRAQWEEMIRVNLLGAALLIRHAGRRMLAAVDADKARHVSWEDTPRDIVVLGSTVGRHISPFSSMYGSTKFGVNAMAEAARRELGPKGVRVTLVEPGFVVSEFQGVAGYDPEWFKGVVERIGPVLTPEDVASAVAWVCALPARVHINDFVIRPTRQDYP